MKRASIVCLLFTALCGCRPKPVQGIVVDDAHNALSPATAKHVPSYTVHPREVCVLDASHYALRPPDGAPSHVKGPNLVTVASPSGMYAFDWPAGATQLTLSEANAKPMGTSPKFSGFKTGEQVIIMIGYGEPGSSSDKLSVFPFWLGQVDVVAD